MRIVILLSTLLFTAVQLIAGALENQLFYYETLSSVHEVKRVRRSLNGSISPSTSSRDLKFDAFGRSFQLILENNADILSSDFQARVIRQDGSSARINVNKNELFKGFLAGERDSLVNAQVEGGIWTANIYTKHDTFHIEPSWRHLPTSSNYNYIAYRGSDIKHNVSIPGRYHFNRGKRLCDGIKVNVDPKDIIDRESNTDKDNNDSENLHRSKRQSFSSNANTCQLYVAADHLFHNGIGSSRPHTTINYLINIFQNVDNIFRTTIWNENTKLDGIGFQLKEVKIHEKSTPTKNNGTHYNMHKSTRWETRDLLEAFSKEEYHSKFCLAHLFTYQSFKNGVLGLAYIASPRQRTVGGICSPSYMKSTEKLTLNTGWSSSMNTNGDRLLTQEANLVTAHELGHNWGSEHDAETAECAPSSITGGGKYIMYPYAVDGFEENNKVFSPCSKRYVYDVLRSKAYGCFTVQTINTPYCGNGKIDQNEECDGGKTGKEGEDPCCSSNCKLKGNAVCSEMNYECCKNCQIAPIGMECREAQAFSCFKSSTCVGNLDCPLPQPTNGTTPCLEGGECQNGVCVSYCKKNGMEPCRCDNDAQDACHRCCRTKTGKCEKFGDVPLPDGRSCYFGFCSKGVCTKSQEDLVQRLFSFIEKLTPNKFVEFMKRNIVGTVIIFSMVIWIPVSWVFSCIDKQKEEETKQLSKWRSYKSHELQQPDSAQAGSIKLRNSQKHRVNRPIPTVQRPTVMLQRPNPSEYRQHTGRRNKEMSESAV